MRLAVRIGVGLFIVLFLLIFLAGNAVLADALGCLLIGWMRFIVDVVPKIRVEPWGLATFVVCVILVAVAGHSFCSWLWRSGGRPGRWEPRWTAAAVAAVVLLFAAGMAFTGVAHQTGWLFRSPERLTTSGGVSNDRNASASLKTLASAQADFRANDRDGNRVQDFWRGDVAGLYLLVPPGSTDMIKLIELSVCGADSAPRFEIDPVTVRAPKAGYWYKAIRHAGEKAERLDPDRFAFCAYPYSRSAGRWIFILSEDNTIYRKPVGESVEPPEVYPADLVKEGWSKLD